MLYLVCLLGLLAGGCAYPEHHHHHHYQGGAYYDDTYYQDSGNYRYDPYTHRWYYRDDPHWR